MGRNKLFKLAKLTIEAYGEPERKDEIAKPFKVQYNPEKLGIHHETTFQHAQGITTSSAQAKFSHSLSKELTVNLIFDGTRADYLEGQSSKPRSVAKRIKKFLDVCYAIKGKLHEPAYLRLLWSKDTLGPSFDCRLKSAVVEYTVFDRDGSPLHAKVKASFVEDLGLKKKAAKIRASSPDLSHRRVVVAGDTLPLLCREIYGSTEHYLRVAEVNGLDGFRVLPLGRELIFPPFERRSEG